MLLQKNTLRLRKGLVLCYFFAWCVYFEVLFLAYSKKNFFKNFLKQKKTNKKRLQKSAVQFWETWGASSGKEHKAWQFLLVKARLYNQKLSILFYILFCRRNLMGLIQLHCDDHR